MKRGTSRLQMGNKTLLTLTIAPINTLPCPMKALIPKPQSHEVLSPDIIDLVTRRPPAEAIYKSSNQSSNNKIGNPKNATTRRYKEQLFTGNESQAIHRTSSHHVSFALIVTFDRDGRSCY